MNLNCRFCNTLVGIISLPESAVVDVRCDTCKVTHGEYKEMYDRCLQKGLTIEVFKKLIDSAEYKKSKFDNLLSETVDLKAIT